MHEGEIRILDQFGKPFAASDTAHFAASRRARELANWTPPLLSAEAELSGESGAIAARSYDLERNNGVAAGAIRTQLDNIFGVGLRLVAAPNYRVLGISKEDADAWARTTEAQWRTFANSPDFDAARQLDFDAQTFIALRESMLSGDGLALAHWMPGNMRPGAKWATCSQLVDSARLDQPPGLANLAPDGIERSIVGEPIAYHIRKSHPGDYGPNTAQGFERVPARTPHGRRRVVHLFEQLRPGQTRGKAILASVMGAFKMLDHYQRTELQSVVINSMIAAFIETPMKPEEIADLFGSQDEFMRSRSGWNVKLEGASVIPLHPGDKLSTFNPSRPNQAYEAFVNAVLRYISTGLNMPLELLMKDFSKTTYSSARAALLEAWRYFNARRDWLSKYWATPWFELWLEEAVSNGTVLAPGFAENRAAWSACTWIGSGRGWVDPMKEAQASAERVRNNVSTLQREAAEQGLDWEEVLEQRAREEAYARSLGLDGAVPAKAEGAAPGAPGAPEKTTDENDQAERDELERANGGAPKKDTDE